MDSIQELTCTGSRVLNTIFYISSLTISARFQSTQPSKAYFYITKGSTPDCNLYTLNSISNGVLVTTVGKSNTEFETIYGYDPISCNPGCKYRACDQDGFDCGVTFTVTVRELDCLF
jgi:hypothetical protein